MKQKSMLEKVSGNLPTQVILTALSATGSLLAPLLPLLSSSIRKELKKLLKN